MTSVSEKSNSCIAMGSTSPLSDDVNHHITVYDKICDACGEFLQRPEVLTSYMFTRTRAYHWPDDGTPPSAKIHSTFANMKLSAQAGCHLCTLFSTSFGTPEMRTAIPDSSLILAEMYRFPDSQGKNMATVCVWPTKTNDDTGMGRFFRKFNISHLVRAPSCVLHIFFQKL